MKNIDFKPPKLPIAWIASTFIAPSMVVILPNLFSSEDIPFTTLVIIALSLLSILLLILCIAVVIKLYDESYKRQLEEIALSDMEEDIQNVITRIDKLEEKRREENRK